jgi:hypothetical protein
MTMKGEIVYLYAFDVANEILTEKVERILSSPAVPFEIRTDQAFPRDVPLYKPLTIEPPEPEVSFAGRKGRLAIRVYDVGVVSIVVRVPVQAERLSDLTSFHRPTTDDGRPLDRLASEICAECCRSMRDAMIRSSPASEPEAYTVFCLTEIPGCADASDFLAGHERAVAGLLSEFDPDRLSEAQVTETLRIRRSFERADAAVIDWDAALVIDLNGYVDDVLFILELANLQIEEFRVMDQKLDRYLNGAYDDLHRRRFGLFGASGVLRSLRTFRVDVAKLADEVTHIGKFFGDWYLARVYLGARERFHLDAWKNSVEQRLGQLNSLYTVVNSEVHEQRMLWLEVIIVVFFAVDLAAILFLKA